jgi:hypothetical protein
MADGRQGAAAPAFGAGAPVQVGVAIKKKPDGGRLPLENRVLQRRRIPVVSVDPVHVGAGIEEEVDLRDRSNREAQRRPRVATLRLWGLVEKSAKGSDVPWTAAWAAELDVERRPPRARRRARAEA